YKAWGKREYIQDSSLTKFRLVDKIDQIILDNININKVNNELVRYLKSLLEFNYNKNLEDMIFNMFEYSLLDKNSCINYISTNNITNFEFNKRLFEFIKNNNLFLKETNVIRLFIFEILYKKLDFKEIFILLHRFDMYSGRRIIDKIDIEDISFLLKIIINNYEVYKTNFLPKQIIHFIFLLLKSAKSLTDKTILNKIFDFISYAKIYLEFEIHRYKDKKDELCFDDIKNQFWQSYFKQNENRIFNRRVLGILFFYDISVEDIIEVSDIYPIEKYKDHYILLRSKIVDVDDFLMKNIEFKNYMEEGWKKIEEQEREWKKEDEIWRKEIEDRDKKAKNKFLKAKDNLETIEDVYTIYNFVDFDIDSFDDEDNRYSLLLQTELEDKYKDYMSIIKNEFIKDISYENVKLKVLENGYSAFTHIINYYFKSISKEEIKELINISFR
ncbi:hypothetical protein, partial [Poseidonibacter sp.]|uniref:hypothetical protein n=1 Tax=Poseidonibacter sp. TaxID=2321188 RepID=UPI003C713477